MNFHDTTSITSMVPSITTELQRFWDPMRGKGCQITSLTSTLAVSNYPERTVSEAWRPG